MATKTDEKYEDAVSEPAAPKAEKAVNPAVAVGGVSEFTAFSNAAHASTGELFEVPKTPKEIAEEGTKLGLAGDHSTGGFHDPLANPAPGPNAAPRMTRVWAMDADHTTNNRHLPDSLKPDCSVES